jgi:hypothetical protein
MGLHGLLQGNLYLSFYWGKHLIQHLKCYAMVNFDDSVRDGREEHKQVEKTWKPLTELAVCRALQMHFVFFFPRHHIPQDGTFRIFTCTTRPSEHTLLKCGFSYTREVKCKQLFGHARSAKHCSTKKKV